MCPLSNVRCEVTSQSRRRLRDFEKGLDRVDWGWMKILRICVDGQKRGWGGCGVHGVVCNR